MDYSTKEDIIEHIFAKAKNLILPSENNNYRSSFLQSNILLSCVVLLLVLRIFTILISVNFPQNIFFADITRSSLENFVNQTRQSMGLQTLTENAKLDQAAQLKAENMVQNQYFDHTSPSGVSPWFWFSKAGYNYKYAGENLAVGFYESKEVYDAWLNSPSHRANILNPNYSEFGTAVLGGFGQNNSIIVVQEFGTQLPQKQSATTNNTPKPAVTQLDEGATTQTAELAQGAGNQASAGANEQVLSQTTESQNLLQPSNGTSTNSLYSKFLNSVLYDYDKLLRNTIYGISLIIIGILLTLIFFSFNINFKKELVFRAVLIIVLLSVATLTNKEIIIALIPHQIII